MNTHFVGNICNNHYVIAKALREIGHEAHLHYEDGNDVQALPRSEDKSLASEPLPDWLHPFRKSMLASKSRVPPRLDDRLKDADVLHVHGEGLIWAHHSGRPYVWHPYGSDIFHFPFFSRFWLLRRKFGVTLPDLRNVGLPGGMRAAARDASAIVVGWYNNLWVPGFRLLDELGVWDRVFRHPLAINEETFTPLAEDARRELRRELVPDCPEDCLLIFHPTRQAFTRAETNTRKANDRLYRALARLRDRGDANFHLVIVERGNVDEAAARSLIRELGLESRVGWTPVMERFRLRQWYQVADLVADHFYAGALGSVPIESMACGTPVLTYMQTASPCEFFLDPRELFETLPPVLNARTSEEIEAELERFLADDAFRSERRRASREWVEGHVSRRIVAERYLGLYDRILERQSNDVNVAATYS